MNRIIKYQESIKKFIKTKSYINNFDSSFVSWIHEEIDKSDYILSIILLTTMNNQNKKNKISLHGYYIASAMEFLFILYKLINNENKYTTLLGNKYNNYINNIILCTTISLNQNIESIQSAISKDKIVTMSNMSVKYLSEKLIKLTNSNLLQMSYDSEYIKTDISKYHFKNPENTDIVKEKILKVRQIDKKKIIPYISNTICIISEISFVLGWLLGCGNPKNIINIEKLGHHFGILIKLTMDFDNIENDFQITTDTDDIRTRNYILNYGFQDSFELFMDNKQKFIESALLHDVYTNTMKDIVDIFEGKMDYIIDQTSPDLKSQSG